MSPHPAPVHVLAVGRYGAAVAARLEELLTDVAVTPVDGDRSHPMTWPTARLHVLASWRETPALAEQLDASAHAWRTPWMPVVVEATRLRVGPLVEPGLSPCHRCFERRRRQHDGRPEVAAVVRDHYARHPHDGPDGFLPAQVTLGVSGVLDAIQRLRAEDRRPDATARTIDVLEGAVAENAVVAVHGCDRCGPDRDPRRASVARLRTDLTRILATKGHPA